MSPRLKFLGVRALRKGAKLLGYKIDFAPIGMNDKGAPKLEYLSRLARRVAHLPGAIVECGLGDGVSFGRLANVGHESQKHVYGFDSFEGFPKPSKEDASSYEVKEGDWGHVKIEKVRANVLAHVPQDYLDQSVHIVPGFFSDSLKTTAIPQISFLHLDGDLYQSYMDCLNPLFECVVSGGIIALDECLSGIEYAKYPGGFTAVQEFCSDKSVDLCRDMTTGKYYILKR